MARPRVRDYSDKRFNLYPPDSSDRIRIVRKVSAAEAADHICNGTWKDGEEYDGFPCFHMVANVKPDLDMASSESDVGISVFEMEVNAGMYGVSRTCGLSEVQRLTQPKDKMGHAPPPEDLIERIQAKVRVWPMVHSRKKHILRVWPKS